LRTASWRRTSVIRNFRITAADGKRYDTKHYSLAAIIAVGYKVNSERAVQFRKWASGIIESFTLKGFAMDDERLKNDGGSVLTKQYFEEQLQRIREIRLSERKFYQKITDIYATAIDYDVTAQATKRFFATVQNKLHWAIHGQTAAEVIVTAPTPQGAHGADDLEGRAARQDPEVRRGRGQELPDRERDGAVAAPGVAYLDVAEDMALRQIPMTMQDWETRLNRFIAATDRECCRMRAR
jgi:hypothetical protein